MDNIIKLMSNLPVGYEQACFETGAMKVPGKIKTPVELITLILMYAMHGLSMLETALFAQFIGIEKISDVAFIKRLSKSNSWLEWILEHIQTKSVIKYTKPAKLEDLDIFAVDASDVVSGGKIRKIYRLHYALDIFKMRSAQFKVTAEKTGESLKNFVMSKKQLYILDRAYGTIASLEHARQGGAKVISRLKTNPFNIYDSRGNKINLLEAISSATSSMASNLVCYYKNDKKELIKIRICALKKTPEAQQKSDKKMREKAGTIATPADVLLMNQYTVLATTLDENITADEILELYRYRWQVELYFKRLKSLMDFGNMPNKKDDNIRAWLNAKLIISLLTESLLSEASFSPGEQY